MPIPEIRLDMWSQQGLIIQSSNTYNSIKNVLEASTTPYASKNFRVFLQGSYGNDTNIYAESDVDIVICLDDCFQSDLTKLKEDERAAYKSAFRDATYTHADFKQHVLSVVEPELTLFQMKIVQMKIERVLVHAAKSRETGFSQAPEAFNPVDMGSSTDKFIAPMIDSQMLSIADID